MDDKIDILLVDDSSKNLAVLEAILKKPSYRLTSVKTSAEALKAILKNDFAVIVLDVFLEETSGLELAAMIRARDKSRHIPIIFLTAADLDREFIQRAYSVGVMDFVQKPLDTSIVRAKVAFFADLHAKTLELSRLQSPPAEVQLRESREHLVREREAEQRRFHDLVEGISNGFVWSADPETLTFNYVSPRAELMLGFPLERWRGEKDFWLQNVHPDDRDAMRQALQAAQSGKEVSLDHRFCTSDGEVVWLHTGVRLARKGAGAGVELRGLSLDVSYLKQIESALKDSIRARDELLSIASHELRTPLTPMLLQVQLLQRSMKRESEPISSAELSRNLDSWRKQIDRLAHLVEDLLDVSRITSGRLVMDKEEFDAGALINELIERFKAQANRAGCEIELTGPQKVIGYWDKSRLEQVFTNLLTNAMKYGPGAPIEIKVDDTDGEASFTFTDHGPGIAPEHQMRIFERFERASGSKEVSGLGLGLYIARNIIRAHGGEIAVQSQVGQGASFKVVLPKRCIEAKVVA